MPKNIAGVTIYNLTEAADEIGVSYATMKSYVRQGRIKATKIGREKRVTEENLQSFLRGEVPPASQVIPTVRKLSTKKPPRRKEASK